MDPQKLSQLDPKLRDAYQRVMGTTIPEPQAVPASQRGEPAQAQTPTPPAPPIPDPTPAPVPQPQPEPESPQPPASEPQSIPTSEPAIPEPVPAIPQSPPPTPQPSIPTPPAQANNFVQMNSEVQAAPSQNFTVLSPMSQAQSVTIKKKSGMMMPILFGIVGLVFIVIYTLFWTKIFNLKLPFLP